MFEELPGPVATLLLAFRREGAEGLRWNCSPCHDVTDAELRRVLKSYNEMSSIRLTLQVSTVKASEKRIYWTGESE